MTSLAIHSPISHTTREGAEILAEALKIVRGETMMRARNTHLVALAELNAQLLSALEQIVCPECGTPLRHHTDKSGCEVDRGDGYPAGPDGETHVEEALGPCACT